MESQLPASVCAEELEAHFGGLPPRYFRIRSAKQVLEDVVMAHRFLENVVDADERVLEPIVGWRQERDRGYSVLKVCTWDRLGLFGKIAGSVAAARLSILGAQVFTRLDGIVLDKFYVVSGATGLPAQREEREEFERVFHQSLVEEIDFDRIIDGQRGLAPLYRSLEGDRIPFRVRFDNEISETRTVLEVETEDRVGLLCRLSQGLAELNLDISLAKICTEKGAAVDCFYLTETGGERIQDPGRQLEIEQHLRGVADSAPAKPTA